MTHNDLAEHIFFNGLTREDLEKFVDLKEGKTWEDFGSALENGKLVGAGQSFFGMIGAIGRSLAEVVDMK